MFTRIRCTKSAKKREESLATRSQGTHRKLTMRIMRRRRVPPLLVDDLACVYNVIPSESQVCPYMTGLAAQDSRPARTL